MLSTIKQRLERDEEQGFTLIELMVVVLIIAILLAIAIPTFLGAKSSANARAAQSDLRNGLTAEQTVYTNNSQAFSADNAAGGVLYTAEPNLTWTTGATVPGTTSTANTVWVSLLTNTNTDDSVILESWGKDGNCYMIQQVNDPNFAGTATGYAEEKGECQAPAAAQTAPAAVTVGSVVVAAKGTFPTFYSSAW